MDEQSTSINCLWYNALPARIVCKHPVHLGFQNPAPLLFSSFTAKQLRQKRNENFVYDGL